MTAAEQKILNRRIRTAVWSEDLPFTWIDKRIPRYDYYKLVGRLKKDTGFNLSVKQNNGVWTVNNIDYE